MGGFKISEDEVRKLVESKGWSFISEHVINYTRMIEIKCNSCKNHWTTKLGSIKEGKGCLVCLKSKVQINRQKILEVVESKGYQLHTDGELKLKSRFKVFCPTHQFEWESSYWNFKYYGKSGGTCRMCATNAISYKELNEFITERNGTFIKRTHHFGKDGRNIIIRCNIHNIEFKTRWGNLKRGIWCKKCYNEGQIIKHGQIKDLVESKNGEMLDSDCFGATTIFPVKCNADNCGRVWNTCYARIKQGCWCPKCMGFDKYTLDDVRQLVGDRGELLTIEEPKNAYDKMDILCKCGNLISMAIFQIARGHWCSACNKGYKAQTELYSIIKSLLPNHEILYDQYPFEWLKDKERLEIDIWIPSLKVAIEYDGKQHFMPVKFANTMTDEQAAKAFEFTQYHDQLKNELILQHLDKCRPLIRFTYKEPLNKEYAIEKLRQNGINL